MYHVFCTTFYVFLSTLVVWLVELLHIKSTYIMYIIKRYITPRSEGCIFISPLDARDVYLYHSKHKSRCGVNAALFRSDIP